MSTVAILISVVIGLVLLMRLHDREEGKEYAPMRADSSVASNLVALGILLGITVIVVRACQGEF